MDYLVRVASAAPKVAVDILLTLKDSDNAWVRRSLFTIGAAVPASEGARLKPVLQGWLESGFGWRTDPREMVDFAVSLFNGGERNAGKWVANVLFRPGARDDSLDPDLVLEEYWYEAGLPRVVEAMGPEGFQQVLGWLFEYEKASGRLDGWLFSRPTIRVRSNKHPEVEDALIDATRDLAVARMATEPQSTAKKLLGVGLMLARRIAMYATTQSLASAEVGTNRSSELINIATQLLFDPISNDERCRVEFGELARAVGSHDPSALDPLVMFIAAGPGQRSGELRERLRRDEDKSEDEIGATVAEFTERWEHLWLASVGASELPALLAQRLADLDERLGVIADPLRPPMMVTSWTGPNSPLTQDEMAVMSPTELVAHLETWHDHGDGWGPEPSHEGQARELTALISSNPQSIAGVAGLVRRLRPTYVRAIFSGWAAAFKASLDLDWDQVADTTQRVLDHGEELDLPREGGDMDDDPDFTWAKEAAVRLLEDLVKKADPPRIPAAILARLVDQLIDLAPAEAVWSKYAEADRESGMDPLTLSLNWQWPIRVRGLAALVGYGPTAPWSDRARKALLEELKRPDLRGASNAVIGENLGRLLNVDERWTGSHIAEWFGDADGIDRGQQIALSTAIAVHHYHSTLYTLLTPALLAALTLEEPVVAGWHSHGSTPVQRIGEWAVKALVYGDAEWDDPVVASFFNTVDARDRGAALGRVAWEFMHASSVESGLRDRFASIWDARIAHVESTGADSAELREFHWVVRSEKFDAEWWLPRLKRALELDPELAAERYMIGKDLAAAADINPRAAFDVTKVLVGKSDTQAMALYELSINAVPMVIARAIAADDDLLKSEATAFMNELGEAGHLELAQQVEAVLDGTITLREIAD
ncbi:MULTISPECIES: hypothetical protein [Rhodococcus]|uniref:hypothetical protein n=1 Tax=Rhodococcus TaxID=1827 RepID=UPI001150EA06|nr:MULTISPECIES: hypothetical protein [Rhodococcus]